MKKKNRNIHDNGYKNFFQNPVAVRYLLTSFVREDWVRHLDFDTLERMDHSFVTDEFRERESDLIYRVEFQGHDTYIYLLIEFQSTVDRFMALRMLRYITEFYEYLVKSQKLKHLPSVFPLLLYNGDRKWTAPLKLDTLIEGNIPKQYIPSFRYYRIAENEFSKETLLQVKNIVSALFFVEHSSYSELEEDIDRVVEIIKNEHPKEVRVFINWLRVIFQDRDKELFPELREIEETKTMFSTEIRKHINKVRTEGIQKGIKEGMQKGKHEQAVLTAQALLKKNIPINEIAEITGLSIKEIRKL